MKHPPVRNDSISLAGRSIYSTGQVCLTSWTAGFPLDERLYWPTSICTRCTAWSSLAPCAACSSDHRPSFT
jgi:hypothetical protein